MMDRTMSVQHRSMFTVDSSKRRYSKQQAVWPCLVQEYGPVGIQGTCETCEVQITPCITKLGHTITCMWL